MQHLSFAPDTFKGRCAYLTGASAGIGAATALLLAEAGADLVLGARRVARLDSLRAIIQTDHPQVRICTLPLDVTDPESRSLFVKQAREFAPCNMLINNAGLAQGRDPVHTAQAEDWDRMIETNVSGLFHLTRALLPDMLSRTDSDIVMIASIAGLDPYAGGSVYCATKAALQAFAQSLRHETLQAGMRVCTINPGLVDTEFATVRLRDTQAAQAVYEGLTPLTADDVAHCIAFALSSPRHMCIDNMLVLATQQANSTAIHRKPLSPLVPVQSN